MNPFGWPQIVIYLTSRDAEEEEDNVQAYGSVHVPIEPGLHKKTIRMFTPVQSSSWMEFFGCFKEGVEKGRGGAIHIDAPEIIAKAEGREVSRVKSGGKITVTMQVT